MTMRRALGFLVAVVGCHAEAPIADAPNAIVAWGISQFLWGQEIIVVDRDGNARYEFTPARDDKSRQPAHGATRLSSPELERLHADFVAHRVCALTSKRPGIPDEGMPTLRVRFPDLSCDVTLWDGEWHDDPDARVCADAIDRIRAAAQRK